MKGERLFPIAAIWNDRFGAALVQLLAQFGAVIGRVAEHARRWLHSSHQALCERAIVRLASSQQDGDKSSLSICECMNFVFRPPRERPIACFCSPLYPAAAERWALMCVESIICVFIDRPFPASCRNRFSQTPRRAQRTNRL